MGERNVLNKFYPPNFDSENIPLGRPNNQQNNVRFMLPMRAKCNTCGNYMAKGTRFNCREEEVLGETYLGIKIRRFYFRCTHCLAEISVKSDPENMGCTAESGATFSYYGHDDDEEEN